MNIIRALFALTVVAVFAGCTHIDARDKELIYSDRHRDVLRCADGETYIVVPKGRKAAKPYKVVKSRKGGRHEQAKAQGFLR